MYYQLKENHIVKLIENIKYQYLSKFGSNTITLNTNNDKITINFTDLEYIVITFRDKNNKNITNIRDLYWYLLNIFDIVQCVP